MNTTRKLKPLIITLMLTLIFCFIAIYPTSVQAATPKLNKSNVSLLENKTTTLKMLGTSQKVIWKTSNKSIATVNSSGKVTAKKAGNATITATISNKKYSCKVTVLPEFKQGNDEKTLKDAVGGRYLGVNIVENTQSFLIENSEIIDFKIKEVTVDVKAQKATVSAAFVIDRTIAKVAAEALYTYSVKSNKWKLGEVNLSSSLDEVSLKGLWRGTYVLSGDKVGVDFDIQTFTEDGYSTGVFSFYPSPTSPDFASGSYTIKGGADIVTGKVVYAGVNWINQPNYYSMLDFRGYLNLVDKSLTSDRYYYDFKLYKVVE